MKREGDEVGGNGGRNTEKEVGRGKERGKGVGK